MAVAAASSAHSGPVPLRGLHAGAATEAGFTVDATSRAIAQATVRCNVQRWPRKHTHLHQRHDVLGRHEALRFDSSVIRTALEKDSSAHVQAKLSAIDATPLVTYRKG